MLSAYLCIMLIDVDLENRRKVISTFAGEVIEVLAQFMTLYISV